MTFSGVFIVSFPIASAAAAAPVEEEEEDEDDDDTTPKARISMSSSAGVIPVSNPRSIRPSLKSAIDTMPLLFVSKSLNTFSILFSAAAVRSVSADAEDADDVEETEEEDKGTVVAGRTFAVLAILAHKDTSAASNPVKGDDTGIAMGGVMVFVADPCELLLLLLLLLPAPPPPPVPPPRRSVEEEGSVKAISP